MFGIIFLFALCYCCGSDSQCLSKRDLNLLTFSAADNVNCNINMSNITRHQRKSNPSSKYCSNCTAREGSVSASKLSACVRCGLVVYCSRDCQKAHWKSEHKQHCISKIDRAPWRQESSAAAGEECSICLELMTDASSITLPCSHTFHGTCVAELRKFGMQQLCPLCRKVLRWKNDCV